MFLKNYTSDVPVRTTIERIEARLIGCGVKGIAKEYGPNGKILALTFALHNDGDTASHPIRLPVNEAAALEALWKDYVGEDNLTSDGQRIVWGRKKRCREDFRQQAERTAWRLMQDWIEVQLSMVQMKQADFMEVFLPYVWNGERTYYQALKESRFKGLLTEKT